ncbi:MAG TPA: SRPBCC domain-containing protein [Parafilimonas sp.]|nr:SRPBCC domain-containing protein [Parafilimonas sp.]
MTNKSYNTTIGVAQPAKEVFNAINDVTNWWSKDFEGNSIKLNDEFIINHPGQHYSKQKLVEISPAKKVVWLVTESKLDWLKNDKEEWTNTKMVFEISANNDTTVLHFTHEGLVPQKECYALCEKGWDIVIRDWLFYLITTGTPSNEMNKAAEIRRQYLEDNTVMKKKDFHRTIEVNTSAEEAMKKISQVNFWWKKDFSGSAQKLNDTFIIPFGEPSFVNFVISEFIPGKKMVWKVTDCYLPWFRDKKEWNSTAVVFELSEVNALPNDLAGSSKTKIYFTHIGLVPEIECYEVCEKGWDGHINTLASFINEGKGLPE